MWRRTDGADPRIATWSRGVTLAATLLFVLVLTRWHPWLLFAKAGYTNDFYDAQARAFLHLRLDVPAAVAGPEGFIVGGSTYLYFGPFLALVRMPFALVGHVFDARLTRVSMVIGHLVLYTGAYHLALEARRLVTRHRPDRDTEHDHHRIAMFVAASALSPILVLAGWTSVYHETELWGAAFLVWTVVWALRFHDEPTLRTAVLATALVAATMLTRATMGFGAAFAVGAVALLVWRRAARLSIGVLAGTALGATAHLLLSYAKLGAFVEMPWQQQQLSTVDTTRSAWLAGNGDSFFSIRFLPTTLLQYLRPDAVRFERLVPFVRFGPLASDVGGYPLETNTPTSSLTVTATVLVLLAIPGAYLVLRRRAWPWVAAIAGAVLAAIPSFLIGFVAARYLADMVPMLMVPAAVGALALRRPAGVHGRRILSAGVAVTLLWGAWSNTAFATWIDQLKEPGFTAWRYQIDDLVFGDPAPALVLLDLAAAMPPDGTVALDATADGSRCNAVYIAEQGGWAVLDRSNGAKRLTGTLQVPDEGEVPVVGGDTWTMALTRSADGLSARLDSANGAIIGSTAPIGGDTVQATVVADPVTHELSLTIDGRLALFSFAVPDEAMTPYPAFMVEGDRGETLCRQLLARR